jgi:AraC family cel operon transcriptional repressor
MAGLAAHRLLHIASFLVAGKSCHFHRTFLRGFDYGLHSHDFHEIFWIENGSGVEHRTGGLPATLLEPGVVALVAAEDGHGFAASGSGGCRMANLAFPRPWWEALHHRTCPGEPDPFALGSVRRFAFGAAVVPELTQLSEELDRGARGPATAERALLNLMYLIRTHASGAANQAPAWLVELLRTLEQPAVLRGGTRALVQRSRRSPEHLAREVRRWYGRTPTDLINDARIAWAARLLAEGETTPLDACLACGLTNLGHFYQLFRQRMGDSPSRWASRQRRIVQPGG